MKPLSSLSALAALSLLGACATGSWSPPPAHPINSPAAPGSFGKSYVPDPFATPNPSGSSETAANHGQPKPIASDELPARIRQFVIAKIDANIDHLGASEKKALQLIIEASKQLNPIFDRQVSSDNPRLAKALAADSSESGRNTYTYFKIMRGPWDRQDHHRPFATIGSRPAGGGFYPSDLSAAEFDSYTAAHPKQKSALENLFTVVRRDGKGLTATPYSKAYAEWLEPAAKKLLAAAEATKNKTLKRFLRSRAAAFASDDYYVSDKDWMDLDSGVEVTIGPYETYEDKLKALKASFESFVTVTDPKASRRLAKYKNMLSKMEMNLPIPDNMKTVRGKESPIRVVDLVYASGDARKSVQTIAFNLPNDERVRKEKGAKKVLLRNVIQTKFDLIMRPIAQQIMDPSQLKYLSAEGFFNEVLFHELSHSLGPALTTKNNKKVEVRLALEELYSAIEECKADVMGAYNILYMIKRGEMKKSFREELLISYFAGLFRSVRFGVAEAHGRGAAVQINRFLEEKAATYDAKAGTFKVDLKQLEKSIEKLTRDLCVLQHNGDKAAAKDLLDRYGIMSPAMKKALAKVTSVPVDLQPYYPLAGESKPSR